MNVPTRISGRVAPRLVSILTSLGLMALAVGAQPPLPGNAALPPPPPLPISPVATFRHLLSLPPAARVDALAHRPESQRALLASRLAAYEALPPEIREERLRATDLYWHLHQLVRRAPQERAGLLDAAPADLRPVLSLRLAHWDRLSAEDRTALLENEGTLRYLAQTRPVVPPPLPSPGDSAPPTPQPPLPTPSPVSLSAAPAVPLRAQAELSRLGRLRTADLARVQQHWHQFFDGASPRRNQALQELSAQERQEMQQVLDRFRRLTPDQRRTSVGSFSRLASMNPAERSEFLRNAERWTTLPPEERKAWRQIVNKLPVFPPLPTAVSEPPLPQSPPSPSRLATNSSAP